MRNVNISTKYLHFSAFRTHFWRICHQNAVKNKLANFKKLDLSAVDELCKNIF